MKRRAALSALSAVVGGSLVAPSLLLSGCRPETTVDAYRFFSREEIALLEQIGETILPSTPESPGAKDTGIGSFMDTYVADCLDPEHQEVMRTGLARLDQRCEEQQGSAFLKITPEKRTDFLVTLDKEAEIYQEQRKPGAPPHYFSLIKNLTLLGYFTSEGGATQALRYVPVPGRYEGNIPYEEGDKAWAL